MTKYICICFVALRMADKQTRRDVLKTGVAIGSVAATGALAGCSSILGGGASTGSFSDVTMWLPSPGDLDSDLEHYSVSARSPSRLANLESDPQEANSDHAPSLEFASPTANDVDTVVNATAEGAGENEDEPFDNPTQSFTAYSGSFNRSWAMTQLDNADAWDDEQEVEEYRIYGRSPEGQEGTFEAVGVSESGYVRASDELATGGDSPDSVAIVETVINAAIGEGERFVDENENMGVVGDQLSFGHQLFAGTPVESPDETNPEEGEFEDVVAAGNNQTIKGQSADETQVLVFDSEGDIDEGDIEEYIEESGSFNGFTSTPTFSISGRAVIIEGSRPS